MKPCKHTLGVLLPAALGCFVMVQITGCPSSGAGKDRPGLSLVIVGKGSVSLAPPGSTHSDVDTPVTVGYDSDTTVTLTATPETDWAFHAWAGNLTSQDNPETLTLSDDKRVTAVFVPQDMAALLTSIPQQQPLTPGTWGGFIIAERTVTADESGQCRDDQNTGTTTFAMKEKNAKQAAVTLGPSMDFAWQQPMAGQYQALMDDSYHTIDQNDSEECCRNPPSCSVIDTVTPGDRFDYLTTHKASAAYQLVTDASQMRFDVVLNIEPVEESEGGQSGLSQLQWIYPYEDRRVDVQLEVDIKPQETLHFTERHQDSAFHACDGTTDLDDTSSANGTFYLDMHYTFAGTLIKRSDGRHEIVGMYTKTWTEDGPHAPCGKAFIREGFDTCIVHLVRMP